MTELAAHPETDLDELDELGVREVLYRPLFSGTNRTGRAAHRPTEDDPDRPACGLGGDLERGTVEDARNAGARLCRHGSCFGEGSGSNRRRRFAECPLCGAKDVELGQHLPRCPRRHEVP